jgi:hypothetical protein
MPRDKTKNRNNPFADRAYTVGHGKPPVANRFPKGQSGNPKGRPKGRRTVQDALERALRQVVQMRQGERTQRVPALDVIIRVLVQQALKGNFRELKLLVQLLDKFGQGVASGEDDGVQRSGVLVVPGVLSDEEWMARYCPDSEPLKRR